MTKCILEKYRKDRCESCDNLCAHRIATAGRLESADLPAGYRGLTLDNSPARESQAKIYQTLERYVESFRKGGRIKSLYLWSESPGTGKTTTAAALVSEYIAADYLAAIKAGKSPSQSPAIFLDVNAFQTDYNLAAMTNDDAGMERIGATIKRLQNAPFAILDDIGVRDATEAFRSYVHAIINYRTMHELPTVYTSNLKLSEMAQVFDARLYDRMRDQCAEIHFPGGSKRGRR